MAARPRRKSSDDRERGRLRASRLLPPPPPLPTTTPAERRSGSGRFVSNRAAMAAKLLELLGPDRVELAVWYYVDGFEMPEIAKMRTTSKQNISRQIATIEDLLRRNGFPSPRPVEHPYEVDHVPAVAFEARD